jgi:PIN domain nuclease of toxin-antitoxin system
MPDVVLDTHACVYALAAPDRLGKAARRALKQVEAGRAVAWIPAAVVAEVVLLRELGRLRIGLPELKAAFERTSSLRFLPLDLRQLDEFAAHTALRDPFDRLIVSACRAVGAKLITKDEALQGSGLIATLWA